MFTVLPAASVAQTLLSHPLVSSSDVPINLNRHRISVESAFFLSESVNLGANTDAKTDS